MVTDTAAAIVVILGAVSALGLFFYKLYRWARRMEDAITYVESEMKFNGGATMRDAMHRLEKKVDALAQQP